MSNPAKKPADKSAAIAPRSHRTRGPRLLLTISEHTRLSEMAKQRNRFMHRINYTDGKLYSGQRKESGQKWIHTSEVQAEIRHL